MSKGDKDLIVAKKNIFSRILSALISSLRSLLSGQTYGTGEFHKTQKKIDDLEDELKEMKSEERRLEKEEQKEVEQHEVKNEQNEEQQETPAIEDISLHLKNMEQDWTKQDSTQIGNKKVDFKEKISPNGNKSSYYAINGVEVLSKIENQNFKRIKLVNYHFDTKFMDKYGVPVHKEVRNPAKDSYQEEYTDYQNKRKYTKKVGPISDTDKNVIGNFKIIDESYEEGDIKGRTKTEQNIRDIETGQMHKIFEERVYNDDCSAYLKMVDGQTVYKETINNISKEVTVQILNKEKNGFQTYKYNKDGELIASFDENGREVFEPKVTIVDGKEEIVDEPRPLPGIDRFPSYLNAGNVDKKDMNNYSELIKNVGVDFKMPEVYYMEFPINDSTVDIINVAKNQMKQKETNRSRIEMKEETREGDPRE